MGGTVILRFLQDGPMSFAIRRASPYCKAHAAQFLSSLTKTRGVPFLWRYGAGLSRTDGHHAVTEPQFPSSCFPPSTAAQ